ncbi:hypothetical protein B0T11DRAFT_102952 [Plectosphaerella cucumerina]|uniref:Uncharacterized protein n=1 Tax=Plectosphaerella cucumerina TaxID=40658 RepID=A0A8K0TGX2_9PEZI|nr:hypothetical protein B0T11DRAFT_102952 [Plectosphaerella cucumerina]
MCTQWVTRGNDGWICLLGFFWVSIFLVFSMASCHGFWECGVRGTRLPTRPVQQDRKEKSLATKIRFRCSCCARVTVNWRGAWWLARGWLAARVVVGLDATVRFRSRLNPKTFANCREGNAQQAPIIQTCWSIRSWQARRNQKLKDEGFLMRWI